MMMSEFVERTGIEPSLEEYHFIEESYYDFDGNKDDFCKAWLKDKKSGAWDKELKLRKQLEELNDSKELELQNAKDTKAWYEEQYHNMNLEIKKLKEDCENLTNQVLELRRKTGIQVKAKDEALPRRFENCEIKHIDNGTIQFYRIEENGWVTCFKDEDIEYIRIG